MLAPAPPAHTADCLFQRLVPVLDFDACSKLAMEQAFESIGHPLPEYLFDVFHQVNTDLWEQVQRSEIDLETLYRIRWNLIFSKLNVAIDGVAFERKFLEGLGESGIAVTGAYDVLEYLSKKYTLCIGSNAPYGQQMKRLEKADMLKYMQHVFISEKIGFEKPSRHFFECCLKELGGICPAEVMMIGDSLSADIIGAKSVGIQTCWYHHNHIPAPLSSEDVADFIVDDLCSIMDIL